jgi:hypothetical protein
MGGKHARRGKQQQRRQAQQPAIAPSSGGGEVNWQTLYDDAALRTGWLELTRALALAQRAADERALSTKTPALPDLTYASRLLHQYPQLAHYLQDIASREELRQAALRSPDVTLASPTGGSRGGNQGTLSGWAGTETDKNNPVGVNNARRLRDWSEGDVWVNSALNFLSRKVARADLAVLPADERKPYNKAVLKQVQALLDQPNEVRDTWPMLIGEFVRDLLTLGQGCLTKSMTLKGRVPQAIYCEDAANIKIYPAWSGDPAEPRYLYQEPGYSGLGKKVPLRNDEAIVAFNDPTSYRFGLGPVQVLADTIVSDLKATERAMRMVDDKPPPNIVNLPGASTQQIRQLQSIYESEIAGRRELMFLGGPQAAQVLPVIYSMSDQLFMSYQEYMVHKITSCFGLTLADLSFVGDVNRATAQTQQEISNDKGYIPLLLLIEVYLNLELLSDFAPRKYGPAWRQGIDSLNLRIVFPEVSEVARRMHFERDMAIAKDGLAGLPAATLNQMLLMRGEEPVPGGNTYYVPSKNGPIPWLSYDGDYGAYAPPVGTQDASGGIDADSDEGISSDDASDDDMGKSDDGAATSAAQADATGSATGGGEAGSSPSGEAGAESTAKALLKRSYTRSAYDLRRPGVAWSPAHLAKADGRAVPQEGAAQHRRSSEELAARAQLEATIKALFGDVERRGAHALKEQEGA